MNGFSSLVVADKERDGAVVVLGADECRRSSAEMLEETGFPKGILPLKDLVECGRVPETGFVWMKQKGPYEHFFKSTATRVRYAAEVTGYVEKGRMKKMTGVKSRQVLMWVPINEMSLVDDDGGGDIGGDRRKIYFKSAVGIGRTYPVSAFLDE